MEVGSALACPERAGAGGALPASAVALCAAGSGGGGSQPICRATKFQPIKIAMDRATAKIIRFVSIGACSMRSSAISAGPADGPAGGSVSSAKHGFCLFHRFRQQVKAAGKIVGAPLRPTACIPLRSRFHMPLRAAARSGLPGGRNRVISAWAPGMAPRNTRHGHNAATYKAVSQHSFAGIAGAGGIITAPGRKKWRNAILVKADGRDSELT